MEAQTPNAPIATDTTIKPDTPPEPVEQPKLTTKERLERLEATMQQLFEAQKVADTNFQVIGKSMEKLGPLVALAEKVQNQPAPVPADPAPAPGGLPEGLGGFMELIAKAVSGGGVGNDSELAALGKEALRTQINLGKSIQDAVISRMTGKAVNQIVEGIAPT